MGAAIAKPLPPIFPNANFLTTKAPSRQVSKMKNFAPSCLGDFVVKLLNSDYKFFYLRKFSLLRLFDF
jgi:hypothetical protein